MIRVPIILGTCSENIVNSLANDETLLNDFLRFRQQQQPVLPKLGQYGSSRYENVSVSIQPTQNYSNHAKSIPTRFVVQPEASTPNKRRLNDSSGSGGLPTSKQQRSNNKQIQANQVILSVPYEQRSGDTTSKSAHQRKIPFEQVKRAISSNLPCFYITFNHVDTSQRVPSAFNAAEQIVQHLKQQDIRINRFTFVGWAGAKLKLGVNNKAGYINLVSTVKWSTDIMNISITIEKPKFIPDCFALVIRYVPRGMDYEFIREEVSRSIASVENVKQLQYAYNRKTDDYRFRVKDFHEHLEVVNLVYKVDASISILTEVGELWNSFSLPNFNTFHQQGTNCCGGVSIAVGKHLKATQVDVEIENTVIVDVSGLSDPIRIVGIYWPQGQKRNLDDLRTFIIQGTIIIGDFNTSLEEWNSPSSDKRGRILKE
ncbi:unnamed protein product [Rotaria sp. Silwood2]|nr:unnamed protein product [Rotaria sp. Silwood2]